MGFFLLINLLLSRISQVMKEEMKEEPWDCCPDLADIEKRKHAYVEHLMPKVSVRLSCDAVWFFA